MRYTHNIRLIRKRKHTLKISFLFTLFLLALILVLGFTTLDAQKFFLGFIDSFLRVCVAYIISLLLALVVALLVTSSNKIEIVTVPILDVLQSFPSFALFPLLLVWFGKTALVTICILVVTMIWPILFTLISAQKQLRQDILDAAKLYGARGGKYLWYVLLPLLFPSLVTGSLISWGEAWEAIIAAEIIVSLPGVGTYLAQAGSTNQTNVLLIGILLLLLLLFIFNKYVWLSLLNISTRYQQE